MEGGGGEDYALRDSLLVIYTSGVALIGFTIAVWSMLLPTVIIYTMYGKSPLYQF